METTSQQLTVKQQTLLEKIQQAGNYSPVGFAKRLSSLKKIKELDENQARQFIGLIFTKVANLSGIKDPISDINKNDIREMIMMKYSTLSLEELDYAFRHDRYSGKPIEHFQLFNAEYVAKVIERYIDFIRQVKIDNNLRTTVVDPKKTEEEIQQIHMEFLRMVYDDIKRNKFCDSAWILYDQMKPRISLTISGMNNLFDYEKARYRIENKVKVLNEGQLGTVRNTCRSIVVCDYLRDSMSSFDEFLKKVNGPCN